MKKILSFFMIIMCLFIITGCENNTVNSNNNQKVPDHKIYKYAKITALYGGVNDIYYKSDYLFDDSGPVSYGDDEYNSAFIFEFDTDTGKAISAKMYLFYLDYKPSTEWVDKSIEKYNDSTATYKKDILNVSKGAIKDHFTYLVATIDVDTSNFEQLIRHDILEYQDFEKYRDDFLDMYYEPPKYIFEEGLFEMPGKRIEWSDNELKAF